MLAASITPTGPERTGYADAPGGRIWWRMDGIRHLRSQRVPLIAIHGGPAGSHDYLLPLTRLSEERTIVLYDQLDCGDSDKPSDARNWTVERLLPRWTPCAPRWRSTAAFCSAIPGAG